MVSNTDKKGYLSVQDLVVEYRSGGETVQAVNHISFDLPGGRSLGLVGETGAGNDSKIYYANIARPCNSEGGRRD